jgi:hypothetical protein
MSEAYSKERFLAKAQRRKERLGSVEVSAFSLRSLRSLREILFYSTLAVARHCVRKKSLAQRTQRAQRKA